MSFWVKLERCDAILEDIQDCFDVLRDLYDKFIGFNKTAEETEDNPNLFLNIEVGAGKADHRGEQGVPPALGAHRTQVPSGGSANAQPNLLLLPAHLERRLHLR